jgi:hypothetical protein
MADRRELNEKVVKLSVLPDILPGELPQSHHPFGITLGTPSNMMHLFESGIIKCVTQTFVNSTSTNVRVQADNLMETLFRSQRTRLSNSQNFLRMKFHGGATHHTMLSSPHSLGMMFAFLFLLLTPQDEDICSGCFQDDDVNKPDYNWDSAPGLDLVTEISQFLSLDSGSS